MLRWRWKWAQSKDLEPEILKLGAFFFSTHPRFFLEPIKVESYWENRVFLWSVTPLADYLMIPCPNVTRHVFKLVKIVHHFFQSCGGVLGRDLLCRLRHGVRDTRTFDFFTLLPWETRQLLNHEPPAPPQANFWMIYGHRITYILDLGATDIGKSMIFWIWPNFDRL